MKFALVFIVLAVGGFAIIVTMMMQSAQVQIINQATLNASGLSINQSAFGYWDTMIGFWPVLPIMFMAGLVGFGLYKAIKH